MALNLEDKKALVAEVAEVAAHAQSVVAAEYRGLTVSQMTELRARARRQGVYMRVVKNTLARKALAGTTFESVGPKLKGPLMLAFSKDDPGAAARVVKDFAKGNEKLVATLGSRGKLPVEIVPFGAAVCAARLERLGLRPALRGGDATPFVTDSANWIYDCAVDPIGDATRLDASLRAIPGVVATGLFLGMADLVVIDADGGVETRVRQAR